MTKTTLENCILLGGIGYLVSPGASCHVVMSEAEVKVHASRESFSIPLIEICGIEIAGPGTVTTGGGFAGGGFGVEGALQGIAIATALNMLTKKSKIHTFISITTNVGELHFHYSGMEPSALRMALSGTFTALRRQDPAWQKQRLEMIEFERAHRGLTNEEYERLQARILQPSPPESAELPVTQQKGPIPVPSQEGPQGNMCWSNFQGHLDRWTPPGRGT